MCHIFSGHKESTSLFEAARGVGQKRWRPKRWLQQKSLKRQIRDTEEERRTTLREEERRYWRSCRGRIKHPPPHPFSSHSFSIPLPHLHGVSRVHAILHSFAYPLKPLTQASISIQPIPILHATHNNVLPYPDVSHPEFFSVDIPSGCLTSGILLRRHSIRMSHIRNSSPSPFHPDVSHPESFSAAIPSGCLTSGILFRRHSIRMSHIRNPSPPPFHPDVSHLESFPADIPLGCLTSGIILCRHSIRMSHIRNPISRSSTFSGCLTSGILSSRHSTFSGCLTSGILSS
uniref:Uncharacterized protein n=1 Tax=Vitis vinifera TaxID=29760 RepID=A5AFX1_VITVI|nr:hypothetical protein VITISV_006498 [Vitis vinifera]